MPLFGPPPGPPLAARAYIVAVLSVAAVVGAAITTLPGGGEPWASAWPAAAILFGVSFVIHVRPLTLPWRGERIAIYLDEAVVALALLHLGPAPTVFVAAAAMLVSQASLRKPLVKVLFNGAMTVLATSAGAMAFVAASMLLGHAGETLLLVPLAMAITSQLLVAVLLSLLAGHGLRDLARAQLGKSIALQAMSGGFLTLLGYALHGFHPAAPLLLLPVAYLAYRAIASEYRHEAELETRRILNQVSERLVGEASDDRIVGAVHDACRRAMDLHSFEVHLEGCGEQTRRWSLPGTATGRSALLRTHLVSRHGQRVGELVIATSDQGGSKRVEDAELVSLIGGYLSIALSSAAALRAAKEAEDRLRQAFESAQDALAVVGAEGRIEYANPIAQDVLGLISGTPLRASLETQLAPAALASLEAATRGGARESTLLEAKTQVPSGPAKVFEFSISPLALPRGERGALVAGRDITRRVELEEQAERQRRELSRVERLSALGTLVAGVAHEINNPLAYIRGNLDLVTMDLDELEEGADPEILLELRERLQTAMRGVDRVGAISSALAAMAGQERAEGPRQVDVNEMVIQAVRAAAHGREPGGCVELDLDPSQPSLVGRPKDLERAISNVVLNALEAVPEQGGSVRVSTRGGDEVRICVSDNGPGIQESERTHLFDPFYTTKPDGVGLGLSIAHRAVREHEGCIDLEAVPGGGACFVIRLPVQALR